MGSSAHTISSLSNMSRVYYAYVVYVNGIIYIHDIWYVYGLLCLRAVSLGAGADADSLPSTHMIGFFTTETDFVAKSAKLFRVQPKSISHLWSRSTTEITRTDFRD